jgi:glycogen debranching enzyme
MFRGTFLWEGVCYQRNRLFNYGRTPLDVILSVEVGADYADVFEVRGEQRAQRGTNLEVETTPQQVVLGYQGLDEVERQTRITFSPRPDSVSEGSAHYEVHLDPKESKEIYFEIACEIDRESSASLPHPTAYKRARTHKEALSKQHCSIHTSNEQFNDWLGQSTADLHMMLTNTGEEEWYPYAGVPWFSTPFGRDGLVTALECLWNMPFIAKGVLQFLARTQATEERPEQDAEPGKILHETRKGEMAALGEIPFSKYYGTVDATPLFVMLAGAYYQRTGDVDLIRDIWPNIERALQWIDTYGDVDGDGFVEYARKTSGGLRNQGWKDSSDAIFREDGSLVDGNVALCEVQGYVYSAKTHAAKLARVLGQGGVADRLQREAETLRGQFERSYWCEEISTYALALDGEKNPCRVRSSNAGHALFTEIASDERAEHVAETLFDDRSYCSWGIRTIAHSEPRYNPMSYHNGSIWPHDNAIIASGLGAYGFKDKALDLLTSFFDASLFVDSQRLPELFCGFRRRSGKGPILYPVACIPQAWAAGSVFMLLQACLGLSINAPEKEISFYYPLLPQSLQQIEITNLRVGTATVDLRLDRHGRDVGVTILDRDGEVEVAVKK